VPAVLDLPLDPRPWDGCARPNITVGGVELTVRRWHKGYGVGGR